jgi:hypothetical protein
MGYLRAKSHRRVPIQMLLFGLVMLGANAYVTGGGETGAKRAVIGSLKSLAIQVPAGIVAVWLASRLIDFDFGTISVVALKIAGISVLAEGVSVWVHYALPYMNFVPPLAALAVMLVGFFWLFELSKWETYLIVFLNLAALFGAHYLLGHFQQSQVATARPAAARHRR